jgi:predicted AAA+ superfamily ATPase
MMFVRDIEKDIIETLSRSDKQVVIIYGPRQSGKTTLIKNVIENFSPQSILFYTGDDLFVQDLFSKPYLENFKKITTNKKLLIIDEAQRIANIGLSLKLINDNLDVKIIVSGSSSFELGNKITEPLTGRSRTFLLYPLSFYETNQKTINLPPNKILEELLIFGMYPKIHCLEKLEEKQNYLYEYINSYLYKDILTFQFIKKPRKVIDLLTMLALQIGNEVSIQELASNLSLSKQTIEVYLDILEKMFVIVNLRGFSRNLRNEITKTSKYYFIDTGFRNALIKNFNPLDIRDDAGKLFENWFIIEMIKHKNNRNKRANFYFWRTYEQKEIDLIEEYNGKITAYECKFNQKDTKLPKQFIKAYPDAKFFVVNQSNFDKFILSG